jgi:hypothetical protein
MLFLSLLQMFVVYYHFLIVLNDLLYNNFYFFLVFVSKHMSNNKVKVYTNSRTSMFVNVVSCVACLSIICCTTSGVKMHILLVFYGCSKIVLYFWNQGFVCIFCENISPTCVYFFYCESAIHHAIPTQKRTIKKTCFYNLPCSKSPVS